MAIKCECPIKKNKCNTASHRLFNLCHNNSHQLTNVVCACSTWKINIYDFLLQHCCRARNVLAGLHAGKNILKRFTANGFNECVKRVQDFYPTAHSSWKSRGGWTIFSGREWKKWINAITFGGDCIRFVSEMRMEKNRMEREYTSVLCMEHGRRKHMGNRSIRNNNGLFNV